MPNHINRRRFLKSATAAFGAMPLLAGSAHSQGMASANDRITMGCIGLGGQGYGNMSRFLGSREMQIRAVCDVYVPHAERAKNRVDGTYGNEDCKMYNDFRELLDRDDIDCVLVCTPDHWHTRINISACEAGKDIYSEKPLTLTIDEGKALVRAVRRYGRVFQVGSQQRSSSNFRFACELVQSGKIGKVHTVKVYLPNGPTGSWTPDSDPPEGLDWNMYLGPAPWRQYNKERTFWNFRWFWDYSGGQMTDWGAHHFDIAQWGLGTDLSGPVSVEGAGTLPADGIYETYTSFNVNFEYENGIKMIATNPEHGTRFEGSDGWVHVWRGGLEAEPKELLHLTLGPGDVHLYESPGHHQDFINSMKTRQRPICDVEIGHRSVSCAHLANIALRLGRKLQWDPVKEEFVNDPEANLWLFRPYRAPWYL